MKVCIYCNREPNSLDNPTLKWADEHCLPNAFGQFKNNDLILYRVLCKDCNNTISSCEGQLFHSGHIAWVRDHLPIVGYKNHKKVDHYYDNQYKAPAMELTSDIYNLGLKIRLRVNKMDRKTQVLRQIIISTSTNKQISIAFPDKITATADIIERAQKLRIVLEDTSPMFVSVPAEETERTLECIKEIWPSSEFDLIKKLNNEPYVHLELTAGINDLFFRAIAKIAFHYSLAVARNLFTGDLKEFKPIKDFILNGNGDKNTFVNTRKNSFISSPYQIENYKNWYHLVSTTSRNGLIKSRVQIFCNEEHKDGFIFDVNVGNINSLITHNIGFANRYVYYDDFSKDTEGNIGIIFPTLIPYIK